MKNLKMGFAALPSSSVFTTKADPELGLTPTLSYVDYTGDYTLSLGVSLLTVISFAASGLILIAGTSAALYYFVIKKDTGDKPDAPLEVEPQNVVKPPT